MRASCVVLTRHRYPSDSASRVPVWLACAGLLRRSAADDRAVRAPREGRDPHLDHRDDHFRDHRRGHRRHRSVLIRRTGSTRRAGTSTSPAWPDKMVETPDFSLLGNFSLFGSFESAGVVTALLFIFTLLLADFFDTMGTMTAIGAEAGLLDKDGTPPNTQRILIVDSIAAAAGGAASDIEQHVVHRVGVRCRRGCAHRARKCGDGRAVPVRDDLRSAGRDHPERGGYACPGPRRLPDDDAGEEHRLG